MTITTAFSIATALVTKEINSFAAVVLLPLCALVLARATTVTRKAVA